MPYSHLTNAVISSDNISEHDYAMLQKDVPVRMGDDAVVISHAEEEEEEQDEGHIEINLNTETGEADFEEEEEEQEVSEEEDTGEQEEQQEEESQEENLDDIPEFHKVDPKNMEEASQLLRDAKEGQDELFKQAVEKGVDAKLIEQMNEAYIETGKLTKAHYAALAEAGYTKAFIDSYIKGQDAVAEKFANSVMSYCGGVDNYTKITDHMSKHQNHMVDAFNSAIERGDTATMRALLDATRTSMEQTKVAEKASKKPSRNLAATAKPKARPQAAAVEGYRTKAEMVKDMSNPKYGNDPEFRRMVEMKVMSAQF